MVRAGFFNTEIVPVMRHTALVVDSDRAHRRSVGLLLRERGYSVLEASSYPDARRLWDAEQPEVLVADIRLGAFNGLQLLIRAHDDRPDLAAVITSPVEDKVLAYEAKRFGATFFVKPVAPERLLEAIGYGVGARGGYADAMLGQPFGAQLPQLGGGVPKRG